MHGIGRLDSKRYPGAVDLYLFLDESGNYDFSPGGTAHLVFGCLSTTEPRSLANDLLELRHSLIRQGYDQEYFHATEDKQPVRDEVFDLLRHCDSYQFDAIVVRKNKTNPSIADEYSIYPKIYRYLIGHVLKRHNLGNLSGLMIFTDTLPVKKKKSVISGAIKSNIAAITGRRVPFQLVHHAAKSHPYLQLADYCTWAVYVKWERGEIRPRGCIAHALESEFDIFRTGQRTYY